MIGACLAPTDPILANAVIKGKFANRYIPGHLRNLLSVESAANDGLGFPFLMLPIFMTLHKSNVGAALTEWMLRTWLYEIFFSIVVGFILGWVAKKLLEKSEEHHLIDKESFLVYAIALAMTISGLVALISSDDLLSVFIAGNVFAYDDKFHQATKDAHFQGVLDMMFNITFFVFLGAVFPWARYLDMGVGYLILTAVLVLLFRRLPFMMAARRLIPQIHSNREAFFCGWFGPMGVGAIFFAMVCFTTEGLEDPIKYNVFTVVTFVVLSSIIIHGITVPITHISLKTKAKRKLRKQQMKQGDIARGIGSETEYTDAALPSGADLSPNYQEDAELTSDLESHSISPLSSSELPSFVSYPPHHQAPTLPSFMEKDSKAVEMANAIKVYEQDPYAETLDMRGMEPHEIIAKIYGKKISNSQAPNGTDSVTIPLPRADTFESTES